MKKKILKIILILFAFVSFLIIKNIAGILGIGEPTKHHAKKMYYANESELKLICDLLQENPCSYIRLDLHDSTQSMSCSYRNSSGDYDTTIVEIHDNNIIDNLENLKKSGFIRVLKEYNYIYFQFWGSFGESVGIAYTHDENPNTSELNTIHCVVEKLDQTEWFYIKEVYE